MRVLITGTAGFVGFHLARVLLGQGFCVHGYDGMTDYYDVSLKIKRNEILSELPGFSFTTGMLENMSDLADAARKFKPEVIIHLAAQAGVRYSLENPRSYIQSNIVGTFNVMELARELNVKHLLMASTSSVYGANEIMPFIETEKADTPITIYAASKKATESMAHSYAHLWNIPTTMFRFFTVYGPWGRPDMALFKFTKAILNGDPIDVYNHGDMYRDFTYVEDLAKAIMLLIKVVPGDPVISGLDQSQDSLSHVAPFRIVNIGNSDKVKLLNFIDAIEDQLGIKAKKNMMPMQTGDVPATWANVDLLEKLTGYRPQTNYKKGVKSFIEWYLSFYHQEDHK